MRDLTTNILKEVCHDVAEESTFLPLDGEQMRTANTSNEARVYINARAFFETRIFNPMVAYHRELSLETAHIKNERKKKQGI